MDQGFTLAFLGTAGVIVAAVVGGGIAAASQALADRRSRAREMESLKERIRHEKESTLLPLQHEALEFVWLCLLKVPLGEDLTQTQKDQYLAKSLWLPASLRKECIDALSDKELALKTLQRLVDFVTCLEGSTDGQE